MLIMGVDPSLANTGVAIYDTRKKGITYLNTIITKKREGEKEYPDFDEVGRARAIIEGLDSILDFEDIYQCCVEAPKGAQDANAAKALGISLGIIGYLGSLFRWNLLLTKPIWVKDDTIGRDARLAPGTPSEKKRRMIDWAEKEYPDAPWIRNKQGKVQANQEHVADAIAIIHSGLIRNDKIHLLD